MRNPLLYRDSSKNRGILSYMIGNEVVWTHTIEDVPQEPYRKNTLPEFKIMIENESWEPDENTIFTWDGAKFVLIERKKYWK